MERLGGIIERSLARGTGPFSGLLSHCESVVEQAFAASFLVNQAFKVEPNGQRWRISRGAESLIMASQYDVEQALDPWAKCVDPDKVFARADFALLSSDLEGSRKVLLLVEIDGHDWHEKDRKQVAKDRARDRRLLRCRLPVARFTGSEVHKGAGACAVEAYALALTLRDAA